MPSKSEFEALLFTDGGARNNPGPAGIGFELEINGVAKNYGGAFIGVATNNVAEYEAIIWGLENALEAGAESIELRVDSELAVKQLKGEYKVKNADLKPLHALASKLLSRFKAVRLEHIPREENAQADRLVNEAIDKEDFVGNFLVAPRIKLEQKGFDLKASAQPQEESTTFERTDSVGVYELSIKDHFDAAHELYDYPGECRNLHGHTWDVEVSVFSPELDEIGIVYDFKSLKADLKQVLDLYDHKYLNDIKPFDKLSPTAENLAKVIYEKLEELIDPRVSLKEVAVWESPIARVAYRKQ